MQSTRNHYLDQIAHPIGHAHSGESPTRPFGKAAQPYKTVAVHRNAQGASVAQLASLTPLRGIAALWVAFYHLGWQSLPQHPGPLTTLLAKGYLAVDFFFMLSGFVLSHVYWREFAEHVERRSYVNFMAARVARIYPLHLALLAIFVALAVLFWLMHLPGQSLSLWGNHSLAAFIANAVMLQGLYAAQLSWDYPSWSISLEFFAYLALPLVLVQIYQRHMITKALAALAMAGIIVALAATHNWSLNHWLGLLALARCLPEFLLGVLIYDVWRRGPQIGHGLLVLAAAVASLAVLEFGWPDPIAVALFAMIIPLSVSAKGLAANIINWRGFVWLGEISYGLYLVHAAVQYVFLAGLTILGVKSQHDLSPALSIVLVASAVVTSLFFADLAHRHIEVPAQKALRERLSQRKRITPQAAREWAEAH